MIGNNNASAHPREGGQGEIIVPASVADRMPEITDVITARPHPKVDAVTEMDRTAQVTNVVLPHPQFIAPNKLSTVASLALVEQERDPIWMRAKEDISKSTDELLAQHQDELNRGLHFRKIFEGNLERKEVAITFDDGPHAAYTPQILQVLKQYHAKATFFVVGEQAERYPDLVRDEIAAGDSVGNHTYDHVSLVKIPQEYAGTEIKACGDVLQQITGRAPHLFRPPGGVYNEQVAQESQALGYTMVLWTDDPGDYASPGDDVIMDRTLSKINNGSIILLHDGIQQTIDILPNLLQYLHDHGYQTVTVDEMLRHQ